MVKKHFKDGLNQKILSLIVFELSLFVLQCFFLGASLFLYREYSSFSVNVFVICRWHLVARYLIILQAWASPKKIDKYQMLFAAAAATHFTSKIILIPVKEVEGGGGPKSNTKRYNLL